MSLHVIPSALSNRSPWIAPWLFLKSTTDLASVSTSHHPFARERAMASSAPRASSTSPAVLK